MREGWRRVPLGDLTEQRISSEKPREDRMYTLLGVRGKARGAFVREAVAGTETSAPSLTPVYTGDFLYNRLFAGTGSFGIAGPEHNGCWVSKEFPVFTVDEARLDSMFLRLFFEQPSVWRTVAGECIGTTGSRMRWKEDRFAAFSIDLPPLPEQRRIVDLIGAVDAQIEAADHAVERAERARRGLLSELLAPAMREGWRRVPLGEVVHVNPRDRALSPDAPFIPMDAVPVGGRWPAYTEPRGTRGGARAGAGDVLFPRITPCLENGKLAQVPFEVTACGGSTELIVLRAGSEADAGFVFALCSSSFFRRRAEALMTGSTGRQRVSGNDLGALEIDLPPLPEQRRIVDLIGAADSEIRALKAVADQARELRKGLLIDLLSGAHEIPASYDRLLAA